MAYVAKYFHKTTVCIGKYELNDLEDQSICFCSLFRYYISISKVVQFVCLGLTSPLNI